MSYVSGNYKIHPDATLGKYVCTRTSNLGPYADKPPENLRHDPHYCGQCVSYVTTVCPTIPVDTGEWDRGGPVKDNASIVEGTVIATFDAEGNYHGHAAIYVSQDTVGIHVYDQWITGSGKPIGPREGGGVIKWNGNGVSNKGTGFYVVE